MFISYAYRQGFQWTLGNYWLSLREVKSYTWIFNCEGEIRGPNHTLFRVKYILFLDLGAADLGMFSF